MSTPYLTYEQLEKLPTKRLLAYLNTKLRKPAKYEWGEDGIKEGTLREHCMADCKVILSMREHIEKKGVSRK
jgi:hypothetical protein